MPLNGWTMAINVIISSRKAHKCLLILYTIRLEVVLQTVDM